MRTLGSAKPHVVHCVNMAIANDHASPPSFGRHVLNKIFAHAQSKILIRSLYFFVGQILNKRSYQALGMLDELPTHLSRTPTCSNFIKVTQVLVPIK